MIFKSYKINLAIRLLFILINSLALSYYLINTNWYIISINLGLILFIQMFLTYRYLSRISNDLTNFFNSLKHDDSGIIWNKTKANKLFAEVYKQMSLLDDSISNLKIEKQRQDFYLSILAEHVSLGLIIFDQNGNVELINKAVKNLLSIEHLKNISSLDKIFPEFSIILLNIGPSDQKLSRLLTHEIMNSIAPISSTIKEITRMMKETDILQKGGGENSGSLINKTKEGLEIIEERSNGLLDFVTTYRKINSVPDPKIDRVDIKTMINGIVKLLKEEIKINNIDLYISLEEDIVINADIKLLQQIVLNLINNSIDALDTLEQKEIKIRSFKHQDGRPSLEIEDKGCGIPQNIIDQIFVLFFTTKEKGSGIGLSLSSQIMLIHGGSISVQSEEGKGSTFTLRF